MKRYRVYFKSPNDDYKKTRSQVIKAEDAFQAVDRFKYQYGKTYEVLRVKKA